MLQLPSSSMRSENLPLRFLEWKHPKRVKIKMAIIEQTKGFSVSVVIVSKHGKRTENKARFSPNILPVANYFQLRETPEVDRILHTYWHPQINIITTITGFLFNVLVQCPWWRISEISYLLHEESFLLFWPQLLPALFVTWCLFFLFLPEKTVYNQIFPCYSWVCNIIGSQPVLFYTSG